MAFRLQVRQVNNLVMNLNYGTYPTAVNKDPTKLNILEDGHIFFCFCFGFVCLFCCCFLIKFVGVDQL